MMNELNIYIKECEIEYMQLLGLNDFPTYTIKNKEISLTDADEKGYDSLGSVHYNYKTGEHTLIVWSDIYTLGEVGKQTIFHEFTHILDDEIYVNENPEKYVANHGYTEYHAAQIGFLKVLGVKRLDHNISFSMSDLIDTESGYMTIHDYVNAPLLLANNLISSADFPLDFAMLKDTMGVIFNYFGRRSICKMYSKDYQEDKNLMVIAKLITPQMVAFFETFLTGWLTEQQVAILGSFYKDIFMVLVRQYRL